MSALPSPLTSPTSWSHEPRPQDECHTVAGPKDVPVESATYQVAELATYPIASALPSPLTSPNSRLSNPGTKLVAHVAGGRNDAPVDTATLSWPVDGVYTTASDLPSPVTSASLSLSDDWPRPVAQRPSTGPLSIDVSGGVVSTVNVT